MIPLADRSVQESIHQQIAEYAEHLSLASKLEKEAGEILADVLGA
jgi:hypothetical protein